MQSHLHELDDMCDGINYADTMEGISKEMTRQVSACPKDQKSTETMRADTILFLPATLQRGEFQRRKYTIVMN